MKSTYDPRILMRLESDAEAKNAAASHLSALRLAARENLMRARELVTEEQRIALFRPYGSNPVDEASWSAAEREWQRRLDAVEMLSTELAELKRSAEVASEVFRSARVLATNIRNFIEANDIRPEVN